MNADDLTYFHQWQNSPTSHVVPIGSLMFPFSFHMLFPLVCSYCQSQPFLTYITYCFLGADLSFLSSKWRQLFPGRHWYLCTRLHVEISQKTVTLIFIFCLFTYLMIMPRYPSLKGWWWLRNIKNMDLFEGTGLEFVFQLRNCCVLLKCSDS